MHQDDQQPRAQGDQSYAVGGFPRFEDRATAFQSTDFAIRPRLVIANHTATVTPELDGVARALHLAARVITIAEAIDPNHSLAADVLWLTLDEDPGLEVLQAIATRIDADAIALVLHVSGSAIDSVWALFGDRDGTAIVIHPDETDCAAALAQALRVYRPSVASTVDQGHDIQIIRLQEEVQRISHMLARLSLNGESSMLGHSDGARLPLSPFIEDHVQAPVRGYQPQPDFATDVGTGHPDQSARSPIRPRDVRAIIRQRRLRDEIWPSEMFADPAWDMMLDLYAARLERQRVSVSSLCIAAAVPATTALRWIKTLTETGIFERQDDPRDGRRIFVTLTDQSLAHMHLYFQRMVEG